MSFHAYARTPEGHLLERYGLDFEDFQAGQKFAHRPGLTVSQQDNVIEALDTINAAMLHYDQHYAAQTSWKHPLIVSTITLRLMLGMSSKTFARRQRIDRIAKIAMTSPVLGGDTLYAESEILECHDAGEVSTGVVTVRCQAINQRKECVAQVTYQAQIWKRAQGPSCAPAHIRTLNSVDETRLLAHHLGTDGMRVEQTGLFFEDFNVGETFLHWPCRTLTAEESRLYALRSMDMNPKYHDLNWMAEQAEGKPSLTQSWVLGIATALTTRTLGRVVANLGWQDIEFHTDVEAGDTLRSESTILDVRSSGSRPNEGILTVRTESFDQRERKILSYVRNLLVYRKSAPSPYAAAGY